MIVALLGWGRFNYQYANKGFLNEEFVVNWVAARALVIDGGSPYHASVTREILTILGTGSTSTIGHVPQFTSPIYSLFILIPIAVIDDLTMAQAVWTSLQQVFLVVTILLTVHLSPYKPRRIIFAILVVTSFLGYHLITQIYHGGLFLLSCVVLLLSMVSIQNKRDEIAGILLGVVTIQLPYLILPILFILFWTMSHKRYLVFLWFISSVIILSVFGVFIVSGWPLQYLRILLNFSLYVPASSTGAAFHAWWPALSDLLSWLSAIAFGAMLAYEWLNSRRSDFRVFIWVMSFTIVISIWIGLPAIPQSLVLLQFPLMVCVGAWNDRWGKVGMIIAVLSLLITFFWQWWLMDLYIDTSNQVDNLKLLIPVPLICFLGLYWIKETIFHPKRLLMNELRAKGDY